jgi:hypothetical protein
MYRGADDPRAAVRNAERKVSELRKKHFPDQVPPIPSSVVYGSGSVNAHKYVRTFEGLFSSWLVGVMYDAKIGAPRNADALKDCFPQQWIRFLADVEVEDGEVAMTMLRNQVKASTSSGDDRGEESGRASEKTLEESIVSHLTRVFLTAHDAVVQMGSFGDNSAAAAAAPPVAAGSPPASSKGAKGEASPAAQRGGTSEMQPLQLLRFAGDATPIDPSPRSQGLHRQSSASARPSGESSPQRVVNLGIAQVLCRPGAAKPALKTSKVSCAVEQVLQSYEDREAATLTQQHINEKRGLDNIFTIEKMMEIREKLRMQKQADVVVNALRAAQHAELQNSPAVAAVLSANSAEKMSLRPRPPSGKVETTAGAVTAALHGCPSTATAALGSLAPGQPPPPPPPPSRPQRVGSARSAVSIPAASSANSVGLSVQQLQAPQSVRPHTAYVGSKRDWLPIDSRSYVKQTL